MEIIKNVIEGAENLGDVVIDSLEKRDTPASRAGNTVERVGKLRKAGWSAGAIAKQLTDSSPKKHEYDEPFVEKLANLAEDCETRVLITAAQTRAGIRDQQKRAQWANAAPGMEPNAC